MNLETQTFFKGDSYSFTYKDSRPDLSAYTVKVYINSSSINITDRPFVTLDTTNGVSVTNKDDGAEVVVKISPSLSSKLALPKYYYSIKASNAEERITLSNGFILMQTFMGDYYVKRFRQFLKDDKDLNKGEFLKKIENKDTDLSDYLSRALEAFNDSFFKTEFTMDNFPSEHLLFVGGLLQALTSNQVVNARCALTYQDAGGIVIQDMDRWGRYSQLFNQFFNYWKQSVLEIKRSWNIENSFGDIPSDYVWGGLDQNNILPYRGPAGRNIFGEPQETI